MQKWNGKSKGTPLGYRIFIAVLRAGGLGPAYMLLRFVAFYYFLFSWKSSGCMLYYFRRRLGYSRFKSLTCLYKNYFVFGQTILDKVASMANLDTRFTFDYEGEEYLHQMVEGGKGGLLLSAHVGNWEIAGFYLKRIHTRVNLVMLDAESEKIKQQVEGITGGRNFNIIPIKDDLSHVYLIDEALKNNELVCIHADRYMEGNRVNEKVFLGEKARFPEGVFQMAVLYKVPVSFVFAFKETSRHYHFYATDPRLYTDKTRNENKEDLINDYIQELENKVQRYPIHWFNYYNFWN